LFEALLFIRMQWWFYDEIKLEQIRGLLQRCNVTRHEKCMDRRLNLTHRSDGTR
jgi:hypothetical protein